MLNTILELVNLTNFRTCKTSIKYLWLQLESTHENNRNSSIERAGLDYHSPGTKITLRKSYINNGILAKSCDNTNRKQLCICHCLNLMQASTPFVQNQMVYFPWAKKKINEVAKLTKVPLVIPNYHQPNRGYALVACTHACVLPGSNKLLSSSIKSML